MDSSSQRFHRNSRRIVLLIAATCIVTLLSLPSRESYSSNHAKQIVPTVARPQAPPVRPSTSIVNMITLTKPSLPAVTRRHLPVSEDEGILRMKYRHRQMMITRPRPAQGSTKEPEPVRIIAQSWVPKDQPPKALIFYLHGFTDHSGRFAAPGPTTSISGVESLVDAGYGVFAIDHEGHGRSDGVHGLFTDFDALCEDAFSFIDLISSKSEYSGKKRFILGVSMGGLMGLRVSLIAQDRGFRIDGTMLTVPFIYLANDWDVSPTITRILESIGKLIPRIPLINPNREQVNWNEGVRNEMAQFIADDPLFYSGRLRLGTLVALKKAVEDTRLRMHQIRTPLLLQHGEADSVCDIKGSKELYEVADSVDKTFISYPNAQHDIEYEVPEILTKLRTDRVNWLNAHL